MDVGCCDHGHSSDPHRGDPAYRRVVWAVLAINALMFVVEIGAGLAAGSTLLQADALSVWICTRNDVLGNLAVLFAAAGVLGTGTGWPDVFVATIMTGLALQGAAIVIRQSLGELPQPLPAVG